MRLISVGFSGRSVVRASPVNTVPGPISMKLSTPIPRIASTVSRQRTGRRICAFRSARTAAAVVSGAASTLPITGAVGSAISAASSSGAIRSAAGSINEV